MTKLDQTQVIFDPSCFARIEDGEISEQLEVSDFIGGFGDLSTMPAADMARLFVHVRRQFDALEAARDELSTFVNLMKDVKIPEAFDRDKIKSFTLEDGTRVTKSERTTCKILDQPAAFEWLRENGFPDLIKETVNAQTMGSTARDILLNVPEAIYNDEGKLIGFTEVDGPSDLPAEIFEVKITPTTSITKGKKK